MNKIRVIARIDVKGSHVIKGIHLEGLRKVGIPNEKAVKYYQEGIDEIIFMDAVAAYYDRNSLSHIIDLACKNVFVPITVGGGIRTIDDIQKALNSGADKVAINSEAIKNPNFISEASRVFGSQCIVLSIDAKRVSASKWEAYYDNGREPAGIDAIEWAKKVQELGAGEIMITSIDSEGTKKGFDMALNKAISEAVKIPVIASGGAGNIKHITELISHTTVDAVALASILHYDLFDTKAVKKELNQSGIKVRT